ncbi:MAG: hypothetical protein CM15mP120_19890 [Pseudomonadota bacterium]|nr:MAG: hypothetical protein CM15mP120_19890 [Pseudomonadota bacterium]
MPVNWSAYEDIAEFFSKYVKQIDGQQIYGHMDYGKKTRRWGGAYGCVVVYGWCRGRRYSQWLPVDEWGIRVENCRPVGSSVSRGGAANGPAAVYALQKYIDWLAQYAPLKQEV